MEFLLQEKQGRQKEHSQTAEAGKGDSRVVSFCLETDSRATYLTETVLFSTLFDTYRMRQVLPPPSRGHVIAAKVMGATMWCWILWRFKHDWKDVFVSDQNWLDLYPRITPYMKSM